MKLSHTTLFFIFIALMAASIEPVVVKLGFRGNVSPFDLLIYKHLVAAVIVLPMVRGLGKLQRAAIGRVVLVSLLLFTTNGLVLLSLKTLSAAIVVTLLKTTPALVALANTWRGRDELGKTFWLGFGLCFGGIVLSLDPFEAQPLSWTFGGLLAIGLAILSSTIYRTQMEDLTRQVPPRRVSTYIFLIDGVLALGLLPWVTIPSGGDIAVSAWIGAAAVLANFAFLAAIHAAGATRMSVIDMLQRPLVIVLAAIVLSEPITISQVLGIAAVFLGVHFAKVKRLPVQPANPIAATPGALASNYRHP